MQTFKREVKGILLCRLSSILICLEKYDTDISLAMYDEATGMPCTRQCGVYNMEITIDSMLSSNICSLAGRLSELN